MHHAGHAPLQMRCAGRVRGCARAGFMLRMARMSTGPQPVPTPAARPGTCAAAKFFVLYSASSRKLDWMARSSLITSTRQF